MKKLLLLLTIVTGSHAFAQWTQSFEGSTTMPAGWTVIAGGDAGETWEIADLTTSSALQAQNGTNMASISYGATPHNDILVTPQFAVVAGTSDKLTFWGRSRDPNYPETISVVASTTTATAAAFTVVLNATVAPASGPNFTKYTIDLTAHVGQNIYVGFKSTTTDMFVFDVDNVVLGSIVPCLEPTSPLTFTNVQSTSATVSWSAAVPAAADGYDVYWSTNSTAPTEITDANVSVAAGVTSANISGLTPATKYYVYVRSRCSASVKSVWGHLTALISAYTPVGTPYTYGFDNPLGFVPDGWTGTWSVNATAGNPQAGTQMIFSNNSTTAPTNRWMFSRPFALDAGSTNQITFYLRNFATTPHPQSIKLTVANTNLAADHTNVVWTSTTVANTTWTQFTATFIPTTTGTYYFGINHFSPAQASAVSLGMDSFAVSAPLSADEFAKNDFKVYPNPVSDVVTVSNSLLDIESVTVYDLNGRQIKQVSSASNEVQLSMSDMSAGVYILQIATSQGTSTQKIVKQ